MYLLDAPGKRVQERNRKENADILGLSWKSLSHGRKGPEEAENFLSDCVQMPGQSTSSLSKALLLLRLVRGAALDARRLPEFDTGRGPGRNGLTSLHLHHLTCKTRMIIITPTVWGNWEDLVEQNLSSAQHAVPGTSLSAQKGSP